jgi:hypothetical protein
MQPPFCVGSMHINVQEGRPLHTGRRSDVDSERETTRYVLFSTHMHALI